jgi:tetratricopeptide (TPR) repeat protein
MGSVEAIRERRSIPTYGLGLPEKNPLFFEKRVYQGSCGKVYPVPFIDKVFDKAEPRTYDSMRLENDYVRLVILPEIGGRIFLGQDKVNRDYDFFYRQDVIKPALVGLAGPWISGGVEFNWPQHHRPGTFMPADVHVEKELDGACTVWLSEHDPLNRLKGMHGVRLRPDSALVELRVRLFNRTPFMQTFLWWANVAARVHDHYQSFFPPDVHYVADHAVRAQSSFPVADHRYYGVDYAARPGANDLSWYKNIPVPTSYMVCESEFGFFGGYDHDARGGFIHVANRHISPGKKQWTWGNHAFGWAWDRELTDANGPYVELMAGVYTDNQPDFTYLLPYETKTFSQSWWPYQKIGPVQNATRDAAVRLVLNEDRSLDLGVVVSRPFEGRRIVLREGDQRLVDERADLSPACPWQNRSQTFTGDHPQSLELSVEGLISYRPVEIGRLERRRAVAKEPPMPDVIETQEELYLTAEHLEQYRHPTRYPERYWDEALRRDPLDARTNIAYGRRKLQQGLLDEAAAFFEKAVERLTRRHPNPVTGEAHYYLGLVRRFQGQEPAAYAALYKSTWDYTWRAPAYYELAMLDCRRRDWVKALEHCEASLDTNRQNNKAMILKALVRKRLGRACSGVLEDVLSVDPLDHWARWERGDVNGFLEKSRNDAQTVLDIVYDYADAGFRDEAVQLLEWHHAHDGVDMAVPHPLKKTQMTHYVLAWLQKDTRLLARARDMSPDYFFPSRLHDQRVLEWAMAQPGTDGNAAYALGNYYYDRKRHEEAITMWESVPPFATVLRNLGIAYWNVRRDGRAARHCYRKAWDLDATDARILAEYALLRGKLGDSPEERLDMLLNHPEQVAERDDCCVELAALYNGTGQPEAALALLSNRRFHPWEGGEGKVLRQYTAAHLLIGQKALQDGDARGALEHFESAMEPPPNLGEAYHLLQARADVNYWIGKALRALGCEAEAIAAFEASADEVGDFQAMAVTEHSELSYYRGLSLLELGRKAQARMLFADLVDFAERERGKPAQVDYFATSLPLLLVFEDDLDEVKHRHTQHLMDLAQEGLRRAAEES